MFEALVGAIFRNYCMRDLSQLSSPALGRKNYTKSPLSIIINIVISVWFWLDEAMLFGFVGVDAWGRKTGGVPSDIAS